MSLNMQVIGPVIAAGATLGSMIFQMGKHADKLETLTIKVEAQEKKEEYYNKKINDIHMIVNTLKNDMSYIKEDIHEIKGKIK